jgi:pimeloyl-ACP methyl ester carboxylesterase
LRRTPANREDALVSTGIPETHYAVTTDDAYIAYQELGEGTPLLIVHPFLTHLDVMWEWAGYAKVMRGLAATARAITFDKRGMGLSDRVTRHVDLDDRLDDIRTVGEHEFKGVPDRWHLYRVVA